MIAPSRRSDSELGRLRCFTAGADLRRLVTGGVTATVAMVIAAIAVDATNFLGFLWAGRRASSATRSRQPLPS